MLLIRISTKMLLKKNWTLFFKFPLRYFERFHEDLVQKIHLGPYIQYVRKIFRKFNISYPLIHAHVRVRIRW